MTKIIHPIVIYAEETPNPASIKFVADKILIGNGATAQYLNKSETKGAPLAAKLFEFPFVKSVFFSSNFITITKSDSVNWEDILFELKDFIKTYLSQGLEVISELPKIEVHTDTSFKETHTAFTEHTAPETEAEHKIIEILEQYIRPAVQQDGGLITFRSFKQGVVTLVLKGSCSGCPSSTITLKAGIEGLLKRMMPEVKEVVAEQE